jgi:cytochrome P450
MLFINSAVHVSTILVEQRERFIKDHRFVDFVEPIVGRGLFTAEHEWHKRQHRLMAPAFAPRRVASYADAMVALCEHRIQRWSDGAPVDIVSEMMQLTLAIAGKCLFDADLEEDAGDVRVALTDAMQALSDYVSVPIPVPRSWPTPTNRRLRRAVARLDQTIYRIISERRALGRDRGDVLSMLIAATDAEGDGSSMTDLQLHDEVSTLLIAGHETTASALAWTCYLVAKHRDVAKALQREVDDVLGDRAPTHADLPKLPMTLQVIKEAMRLYPPVYIGALESEQPFRLGRRWFPVGTFVVLNIYAIHRHADYFPNPERFDPERFGPDREKGMLRGSYIPFGSGPRVCIGAHFATMEMHLVLADLIRRVTLELTMDEPAKVEPVLTLRPKAPLWLRVRHRGGAHADEVHVASRPTAKPGCSDPSPSAVDRVK